MHVYLLICDNLVGIIHANVKWLFSVKMINIWELKWQNEYSLILIFKFEQMWNTDVTKQHTIVCGVGVFQTVCIMSNGTKENNLCTLTLKYIIWHLTFLLLFIVSQESHSKLILNRSKEKSLRSGFWCVMWRHTRSWHLNQSGSKVQCIQWSWMQSEADTQCLNKEIHFLFFILHWVPSISSCLYSKLIICSILKIDCLAETTALWC